MTNRIKLAWAALTGRLEPGARDVLSLEERPVFGDASFTEAFKGRKWVRDSNHMWGGVSIDAYYATCAQAHAECPGGVSKVRLVRIGGELFSLPDGFWLTPVALQPKPKRAKGAK